MVIGILKKIGIFLILFSILGFLLMAAIAYSDIWNYPVSSIYPLNITSQSGVSSQSINAIFPFSFNSNSFDYHYRNANSLNRTAQPTNSFQDMTFFYPYNNISYPLSSFSSGIVPQGFGIYPSSLIGAILDPSALFSPWPAMPVSYPYGAFPSVFPGSMLSGFNTGYSGYTGIGGISGITPNMNSRYKVVMVEYEDDNDPVYYLLPGDVSCSCPEIAKAYGIPCNIVENTKYVFDDKIHSRFSILNNPFGYIIAEMPPELIE